MQHADEAAVRVFEKGHKGPTQLYYCMVQVTFTATDDLIPRIDAAAQDSGISRSRWIAETIEKALDPTTLVPADGSHSNEEYERIVTEYERMKYQVEMLNHQIQDRGGEIAWLRGQVSLLTEQMTKALPPARTSLWSRIAFWNKL